MLEMIESVEREIHDIQHSNNRLTPKSPQKLPNFCLTPGRLAEYPSVCERLLKHQLLSETEPDLTDASFMSSSNAETSDSSRLGLEEKRSKPIISSSLKCVSSAVNEIEAKTTKRPCLGTGSRRSMLPRTVSRKNVK